MDLATDRKLENFDTHMCDSLEKPNIWANLDIFHYISLQTAIYSEMKYVSPLHVSQPQVNL